MSIIHRAFTHCINAKNVNEAMQYALIYLPYNSIEQHSRNGGVLVSNTPVITCYSRPTERVLFSPLRDANPFFHLFEALWMLAGRDDVAYPVQFNSNFGQFSDDGERYWGAYGYRWRRWFGYDQIELIIQELLNNSETRRCVLSMWSPGYVTYVADAEHVAQVQPDLMQALAGGKDVPCNTHIYFRVLEDHLDMMVNCRSNDIFWGCYGANAVHFSILQEYIASACGLAVGRMWQNSFNFHAYTDKFSKRRFQEYSEDIRLNNLYAFKNLQPSPLMQHTREEFDVDLLNFMIWSQGDMTEAQEFTEPFFRDTAVPMRLAWLAHKNKDYSAADSICNVIDASDWRAACKAWIGRRWEKHNAK